MAVPGLKTFPEMWKWRVGADPDYMDYQERFSLWGPSNGNIGEFGLGWGLYFMCVHFYAWEWLAILIALVIEFLLQCRNALIPYANFDDFMTTLVWTRRWGGGFGYSIRGQIWNLGGVLTAFLFDMMVKPMFGPSRVDEEANAF